MPGAGLFFFHAFGMELQPNQKISLWIGICFHETVGSKRHGAETRRQVPDSLVVVAVHGQFRASIPFVQRAAFDDFDRVTVCIVVFLMDVLQSGPLLLLHISMQRSAAQDIQKL